MTTECEGHYSNGCVEESWEEKERGWEVSRRRWNEKDI